MKVKPKFHGIWYGVNCVRGELTEIPDHLEAKASSRPDLFTKPGRKKKAADGDES